MSKSSINEFDDEIFDDSSILANFVNSPFRDTATHIDKNLDKSIDNSALNISALCCDEEISGYDKLTGQTWIYPTNYPVRDYQFNIVKAALLNNTLVSLPTGLGKTFIAAVIMYNFYRWYPLGKIIFMAPTRPLVAQQIEACYNIVALPPRDTIEMTGHMQINIRKDHWQSKRVFFATPQVIYNDIKSGICPGDKIRCLVIDEAHKARGNYAYCQIISTLKDMGHKIYRVLALSATPGSRVEDVISVVNTLQIAHLELRTENCIDVAKYSHSRKIHTVIVQLGPELTRLRQQYIEILDTYARRLKQFNILPQNLGNLSKGRVVMLYKEYQNKDRSVRHPQHNYIMKDFTLLIALYHGLELLVKHGSRVFLNFFDDHPEKSWIQSDDRLTALLERLRDDLGINPLSLNRSLLPDGTTPDVPKDLSFGHPKFYKLKEIMIDHFTNAKQKGEDTRAIVFCEYRESVSLVHCLLLQCRPLIVPQMFVGQGASGREGGVTQRAQTRAVRSFRAGACNVLVSTSVAEEGLDVGAVDLCLCFDVSTRSPIRLVQRCGRTGRARKGQVYILVTEGREHQTLLDSMRQRDGMNNKIAQSKEVQNNLYKLNPRMIPRDFMPVCNKMFITVKETNTANDERKEAKEKRKKGQKDLRTMLLGRASTSNTNHSTITESDIDLISKKDFDELYPDGYRETDYFANASTYWSKSLSTLNIINNKIEEKSKLSTWLEWQRSLQPTIKIGHSSDTEILASLLRYSDAKRFDMPSSTQNPTFTNEVFPSQNVVLSPVPSQKPKPNRKKQKVLFKSPCKKDGDIRALFSTATKSTKNYTKLINDLGIQNDGGIPTRLINLLVDLNLENTNLNKKCYICLNVCDCKIIQNIRKNKSTSNFLLSYNKTLKLPDINLIDDFDVDMVFKCAKNNSIIEISTENDNADRITENNESNCSKNFDLQFDFDTLSNSGSLTDIAVPKTESPSKTLDTNFNIGDIEDIFAESIIEESCHEENNKRNQNSGDPTEALGFFGLNSIDDIFADSDNEQQVTLKTTPCELTNDKKGIKKMPSIITENATNKGNSCAPVSPDSPSILSGKTKTNANATSPILCTQVRKFQLSTKRSRDNNTPTSAKKQLLFGNSSICLSTDNNQSETNPNITNTTDKSMLTITQLVDMINKGNNDSGVLKDSRKSIHSEIKPESVYQQTLVRSNSPILLTQRDKIKTLSLPDNKNRISLNQKKSNGSLIVLDSDSDSCENTRLYDVDNIEEVCNIDATICKERPDVVHEETVNRSRKRKLIGDDSVITASPYFNKKLKVCKSTEKTLTLQEKVLAAISSNEFSDEAFKNNDRDVHFVTISPVFPSQKENKNPMYSISKDSDKKNLVTNNIEELQRFRRNNKFSPKKLENTIHCSEPLLSRRQITFNNSDEDDFVGTKKPFKSQNTMSTRNKVDYMAYHKVRKKKKSKNPFIDQEAELSDDGHSGSADELSDDSVGSIIDFICDDNITHNEKDMQAYYMKSVKSPVNGVFKIPEMPKKFDKEEILSQYVEEDAYEMDSFCVDSHIGLTQVDDVSELELAEIILEKKRRKKKSSPNVVEETGDSPIVKRKNKHVKRLIDSCSDDSS